MEAEEQLHYLAAYLCELHLLDDRMLAFLPSQVGGLGVLGGLRGSGWVGGWVRGEKGAQRFPGKNGGGWWWGWRLGEIERRWEEE